MASKKKTDSKTNEPTPEQLKTMEQYGYNHIPLDEAFEKMGLNNDFGDLAAAWKDGETRRAEEAYEAEQQLIAKEREINTKHITDFAISGMVNILSQEQPRPQSDYDAELMDKEIREMVKRMQSGDTTDILTLLTTNLMQMQSFNGRVTQNMSKEDGFTYKHWEQLSRMQMKLLQESRKTVMAINEICNPKRATFVKNATQHNHTHLNSEKKEALPNELQAEEKSEIVEVEYEEK